MGAIVQFDLAQWRLMYPQFSNVTDQQLQGPVWLLATQYCRNDGGSPVNDPTLLSEMLNLMVAHVAQLLYGSATQPVSPLVGHISSATEGSVSVTSEFPVTPGNAWFVQTSYGAAYWQLILPFRLARPVPKITQLYQPVSRPWPGVY